MNKTSAVLRLYDEFRQGRTVCIDECCNSYGISVPTFRRYLALLREYFMECHAHDIIYDPMKMSYHISREP